MVSRFMELERRTLLVQFIALEPLTFYATSDGTDLVQGTLRNQLSKSDANILGQEGSLSIDDNGEFLSFEPTDTKNRALHLPVEHLAYCGALRRMRRDPTDDRNPDQILKREFENVHLANRYAQYIIGPPIFVAIFHGFDNALCYTFVTQSADDACLLVMKLMRAFRRYEQQLLEQQGQINQGLPSNILDNSGGGLPSPVVINQVDPLNQPPQVLFTTNSHILSSSPYIQMPNIPSTMYPQTSYQDDFVKNLLSNPNFQVVNQPYTSSAPMITQSLDSLPIISPPPPSMPYPVSDPYSSIITQQNSSVVPNMPPIRSNTTQLVGGPPPILMPPPNQHIIGGSNVDLMRSLSMGNTLPPQVVHRPNNQEITYKQNIMIRWLKPPTPPPSAPIIIREIQQAPIVQPPIIYRQMAPRAPTPPPIVVREPPPPCPLPQRPLVIEKRLPAPCLPRRVIVEQCAPPPPPPRQIIYEKYLPPPPVQRQVIVQRTTCPSAVCAPVPQTVCAPVPQTVCTSVPQTVCSPMAQTCSSVSQPMACRRLVREIVRQVPQTYAPAQSALVCTQQPAQQSVVCAQPAQQPVVCAQPIQPALVCSPQQQQQIVPAPPQVIQQFTPVFAQRQHVVQPKGIRVIRQVVGPAQGGPMGQVGFQQQPCGMNGSPFIPAF